MGAFVAAYYLPYHLFQALAFDSERMDYILAAAVVVVVGLADLHNSYLDFLGGVVVEGVAAGVDSDLERLDLELLREHCLPFATYHTLYVSRLGARRISRAT